MEKQLNDEKNKSQNLNNENNILKNKIKENEMNKIIQDLKQQLNKEKTKNQDLMNQINKCNCQMKNKNKTNNLQMINNNNFTLNEKEKTMFINFMPIDQSFIKTIPCKSGDILVYLEEKIYNEYPQYKEYNTYLTVNGKNVKRFKTIEENGIRDSNSIIVNIYQ